MKEKLEDFVLSRVELINKLVNRASKMGKYLKYVNESYTSSMVVASQLNLEAPEDRLLDEVHKKAEDLLSEIEELALILVARLKIERGGLLNNSKVSKEDLPQVLTLASLRQKTKVTVTQLKLSMFKNRKTNWGKAIQIERP